MAIGIEVVPTLKRSRKGTTPGTRYPSPTPAAMAAKIQSVRYRSRKDSRGVVGVSMSVFSLSKFL
jgi:hypothetical protein